MPKQNPQDQTNRAADEEQERQPSEAGAPPQGGASGTADPGRPEGGAPLSPARRRGGPRTRAGKERSKYNALKYGFFASGPAIETPYYKESRKEFSRILRELRRYWQTVGIAEEIELRNMARQLVKLGRLVRVEEGYILERHTPMPKGDEDIARDILREKFESKRKQEGQPPVERDEKLEAERSRIESLRKSMPNFDDSDWLQATEASIWRMYYRSLAELERLQRRRLGIPPD